LRTCWVFAARGANFLRTILRLAHEREELFIVADQIGAPTWARHIADTTARIVQDACREREKTKRTIFLRGYLLSPAKRCARL